MTKKRLALIFVIAAAIIGWWAIGRLGKAPEVAGDPRLTYATRFRNVRPEVQFVGDDACSKCHPNHVASYHLHPMGQSLVPIAQAIRVENYDAAAPRSFTTAGFQYEVERRGEQVRHTERRLRPDGQVLAEFTKEVQFAIGAGAQGRSYLFEKDGYLWQSPVGWYRRTGRWDLAPGIAEGPRHLHFERKVESMCPFSHVNRADSVPNTFNRYSSLNPGAPGHSTLRSIGCERCHGPGKLHVEFRENHGEAADIDDTIVNPRHLEPALREAVCQQCHLEPEIMVLRRGRHPFDFRPGMPLHLFWSMFVKTNAKAENKFVSQVDQMRASRCFEGSKGRMGCISCHDPHELPANEEKAAYYRRRCLQCHAEDRDEGRRMKDEKKSSSGSSFILQPSSPPCSLPLAQRRARSAEDSCIQCHMPRRDSQDIAHVWLSDHRIPRKPEPSLSRQRGVSDLAKGSGGTTGMPVVLFDQDLVQPDHAPELRRDQGIALAEMVRHLNWRDPLERQLSVDFANKALALLEPGLTTWPHDLPAREAKAMALWAVGRTPEAMKTLDELLAEAPDREFALAYAGKMAFELRQVDAARDYFQRACAVNPWDPLYQIDLARCLLLRKEWNLVVQACERAMQSNPFQWEAHKFLTAAYLQLGERAKAETEFDILMGLNPPDQEALRRWFREQRK